MSRHARPCLFGAAILAAAALCSAAARGQQTPACGAHSDFLVRSDVLLAPVRPADCATITQTPPEFTWPPQNGSNTYTLTLTFPDGKSESRTTTRNFVLWDKAIPSGAYTWRLKVAGAHNEVSSARKFTIAAGAVAFVVPTIEESIKRARAAPRPRTWPKDATSALAVLKAERSGALASLLRKVDTTLAKDVPREPASSSTDANYDATVEEQKRTLEAALAWAATRNQRYAAEATRRLLAQAAWSKSGPISYAKNDMANRTVAWTLALGYDWLYDYLESSQRATLVAAVRARTQPMVDDIVPKVSNYPYDSHGNVTLTIVAAIATLMAGDIAEADRWMTDTLPMAVAWTSPWGGPDGGFGNGTAQMFWDVGSNLPAWQVLRYAAGVDLAKKEWTRNLPRFMAYFVPPGAPAGNFGDGQELHLPETWARVAKALDNFAPSPIGRWYAQQQSGEDPARFELLLTPRAGRESPALPAGTPNAAYFPSVGWAAMHSSLADPMRTSVYFKSSPYGSYNHSHSDQLSFAVNHKGKRLAIASGYYDGYRTPHWTHWYKHTKSKNAITYDSGQGQGFNDRRFAGEITRFETAATHDIAVGRAEKAYGGQLTRAQRTIVYLRPGVVLVHDVMAGSSQRTWEWNIHAANRMHKINDNRIHVINDPAQMCVEILAGPEVVFVQTDKFTAPPSGSGMPNQWHGIFMTTGKSAAVEFLALLRIGSECPLPAAGARVSALAVKGVDGWEVRLDGKTVTLGADVASVK